MRKEDEEERDVKGKERGSGDKKKGKMRSTK